LLRGKLRRQLPKNGNARKSRANRPEQPLKQTQRAGFTPKNMLVYMRLDIPIHLPGRNADLKGYLQRQLQ